MEQLDHNADGTVSSPGISSGAASVSVTPTSTDPFPAAPFPITFNPNLSATPGVLRPP